jgi:Tfp pilus assembly protein PilF
MLAQAAPNTSALNCRAERQQNQEALLGGALEQAEQYIAIGRLDEASILLVRSLQTIRGMENFAAKVNLLERVVGSVPPDLAYISPLERLVRVVPPQSPQAALAVLSAAYDTTQTVSSGYSASKTRTLAMLANYAIRIGQPARSASILGQALTASNPIQNADFKTIALSGIAEAYINAGQANAAEPILARSLQFAQTINSRNPYPKATALERIASLYARINQFDRALQIVRSISIPNYQSETLLTIVNQYSEAGQVDRALELLRSIQSADQKSELLAKIAGRLTAQQPDRAQQLYSEAISTARSTQNAQAVVTVAVRYIEAGGLVATAEETVQAIDNAFVKAPAQGMIALAYAKAGQGDRAKAMLQQALATVATINDASQRNTAIQQLIEQAIQSGRYDYALQVAQTIQVGEKIPSERVEVLIQIASRAIAAKRYDAALEITTQIPSNFAGNRDPLLLNIARGLASAGEFDRAQAIAQEQSPDPSFRPKILAAIGAQILLVSGQIDPATVLFNQAIELANAINYPPTKAETLAAIASEYLRINFTSDATQLLNQTIATAQSIKDPSSRSVLLRTIAGQLTAANQYQAALQIATAIPDATERTYNLNQAIEKAVNAGDFPAAVATLAQLNDPVLKTRWLVKVADRYRQLGDRTQAATTLNQAFQTARTIPGAESRNINVRGGELPLVGEDDQDRGSFLEAIALKYAQIGQVPQALQVAQLLENRTVRQQLVRRIGCYR